MATRASMAARIDVARQQSESSIERIAAGLGLDVPEPISGIVGKNPEMRAVASSERIAAFLSQVDAKVGKQPAVAEPEATPEPDGDGGDEGESADEEPTFGTDHHPLSYFDGMTDEQMDDVPGVGLPTVEKIKLAQAERDAKH